MAEIVPFPEEAGRRKPDLNEPEADGPDIAVTPRAEVVIFPGVRIERQNFTLADRLPRRRRAASPDKGDGNPRLGQG